MQRSDLAVGSYEPPKSRDSTRDDFGTISGLHFGSPGNLCHLDVAPTGRRRVYYKGVLWWHTPESGPWCVSWSKVLVACPNTQGCPGMWTNHVGGLFWCRFMFDLLNLLPSLIPGLSTRPSTPFLELEAMSMPPSFNFPQLDFVKPSSGFHPVTWERIRRYLVPTNRSQTCFVNLKGILINKIVSIFLTHMLTHSLAIHVYNWKGFLLTLINIHT